MSWNGYIENLMQEETIEDVAIVGHESASQSLWASTPGYAGISPDEIKRLAGDRGDFGSKGVSLCGRKCRMLRDNLDDAEHCMQLKTAADSDGNSNSICVGKTEKAFIIVKAKKDAHPGKMTVALGRTVDHLRANKS